MTEVWLHSNRRVLMLAMVPVAFLHMFGLAIFQSDDSLLFWLGIGCLSITAGLFLGLLWEVWQPRIAFREGCVLFFLKAGRPIVVPVNVVEAFFQGEGPSHLPGTSQDQTKSVNLIARLAQRETDWQQRDVKAALGNWAEGYITVRGTWCEPISGEVIRRLNRRLAEVKQLEQAIAKDSAKA